MDVEALARTFYDVHHSWVAKHVGKWTGQNWDQMSPESKEYSEWVAQTLMPLIEAHTRAAVEAERAACEVLVRAVATTCRNHGADKGADALLIAADAIAARKAQP